ncbi:MAG TPA: DUF3618 domain-containing protein [Pyrinomonadaceae bacterium]|jgi:ElaB/YqjD/DUF883 family membrane-anchored ribosome-binding protein|nr:DUF3618 domain-containing protein [Pyrinomonadaceae bacterium]
MAEKTSELNTTDYDAVIAGRIEEPSDIRPANSELIAREKTEETEHIKAQIEETRAQMGETIDALQEKLSFSNLSEQVSDHVSNAIETATNTIYDATIGKAVGVMKNMGDGISNSGIVKTARENPLPLILIGLGAGLLAYNSYSGRGRARRRIPDMQQRFAEQQNLESSQPGVLSSAQDKLSGVTDKVTNAASSAYEGVSNAMGSAYSSARDAANQAYSKAGEFGSMASDTYDRYLQENPLVLGAAAFAVGAVVGLAIPSTNYEGELMGETRDEFLRKAQNAGSTMLDKTKHLVDEAAQKVTKNTQAIIH